MYIFPDEIKKSYECLRIPLMIMGPSASGEFEPLVISDGLLELGDVSRKDLYGYYANRIKEGLFVRLHPDEEEKLKAISLSFLDKKTEYDITFRVRLDDGYHLIHAIGYWQTMEDGTDLAFMVYNDVQKHEKSLSDISNKYKLFQNDEFYIDALTNLPNINYVNKYGNRKIQEIVAGGKNPVVIYMDIDSMQSYNRRYGVKRGDESTTHEEAVDHAVRANKLVGEDLNKFYRFYTAEADSLYNHQRYIVENFHKAMERGWIPFWKGSTKIFPFPNGSRTMREMNVKRAGEFCPGYSFFV